MSMLPSSAWLPLLPLLSSSGLEEHAHVRKLSRPPVRAHVADVLDFAVAPGEQWLVYRSDALHDERNELFSVPADGSAAPHPLCGPLSPERVVFSYELAPDGQHVVYLTAADLSGAQPQVFSASLDGSAPPVFLCESPPGVGGLFSLELSPDSRRVAFVGGRSAVNSFELFSVPLDGSAPLVQLTPTIAGGGVSFARFSADSTRLVFSLYDRGAELYAVPSDGGTAVHVSGPLVPSGSIREYRLTPDGQRVVYTADALVPGQLELFGAPLDGSAPPQRLTPPLALGATVDSGLELDPAGGRAVYRLRPSPFGSAELHSTPVDGSALDVRLDIRGMVSGPLRVLPTGRVLFLDKPHSVSANTALYSVPVDGSAPALQLGTVPRNSNITLFEPSPDGQRVVFARTTPNALDLYAVNTDGTGAEVKLDRVQGDVGFLDELRVGGLRAAYVGRRTFASPRELFSVPLDGSDVPARLLEPLPPLGELQSGIALAGARVYFRSDWSEDGLVELLGVPLDGGTPPESLSGPGAFTAVGDVQRFERAGRCAVYLADQEQDGVNELFTADLGRGGPGRRLNDPLDAPDTVRDFLVRPDERAVVFRVSLAGRNGLFVAPSDGRTRALKLDPASALVGGVERDYRLTPDGRWLVFVANGRGNSQKDVFVVPSDGSAPARSAFTFFSFTTDGSLLVVTPDSKRLVFCPDFARRDLYSVVLDDPAAPVTSMSLHNYSQGTLTALAASADSRYAVFRADAVTNDRYLLYSWPLDGSTEFVPLMPSHSGGALDFACAADGRVVFRVLQPQDRMELFSVLADGSAPPTPLCVLPPSRRVLEFALSPDGRCVAYRADAETDDRYELFGAPSDGSAPSVKLSYASRRDTDVSAFAFTPDSTKVLFLADTLRNEQDDLYVVPADRSQPPKRLNPSLAPHGTLFDFRCSDDGRFVAYRANHDERAVVELFRVAIEGGVEPVSLSSPPVAGGDVRAYRFASSSEVLYDADQDEDDAFELYLGVLGELRRPAAPPAPLR